MVVTYGELLHGSGETRKYHLFSELSPTWVARDYSWYISLENQEWKRSCIVS